MQNSGTIFYQFAYWLAGYFSWQDATRLPSAMSYFRPELKSKAGRMELVEVRSHKYL